MIRTTRPNFSALRDEARRLAKAQHKAAVQATHHASQRAQKHIQAKVKSVGLGRLSNAVGQTSSLRKRQTEGRPYGVIYARSGSKSDIGRAGAALEAYSRGSTITPHKEWLAFATDAVPRLVGGRRLTPKLYNSSGMANSVGKLRFRAISQKLALLVVRNVSLHPKTGRAKALGPRRPRTRVVPDKDTVVFVLIRVTRRAKRFDKDTLVKLYHGKVPDYIARAMRDLYR